MGGAPTQLIYIGDHAARARAQLLTRYRGKPRIEALVTSLAAGVQLVEDDGFDQLIGRTLDMATGHALEQWGLLVGEPRLGLIDKDYRRFIRARVLVNRCRGTVDELITIYELITEGTVRYFTSYPAGFRLHTYREQWLSDELVQRVLRTMRLCKPAGITMILSESIGTVFSVQGDAQTLNGPLLGRTLQ